MDDLRTSVARLFRRISRPLPAALVFCATGIACAVLVITVNRVRAVATPPGVAGVAGPASASPPVATGSPRTPTPSPSCSGAPTAAGNLGSMTVAAAATVTVAGDNSTVAVMVPAGAQVGGRAGSLHVQLTGAAGALQPVSGTVVQDVTMCASTGSGIVQLDIGAGTSVAGTAVASGGGIEAADVQFTGNGGSGSGGGGSGGGGGGDNGD